MKNIKVTLLHHTPLHISADGARTCWSSQDKSDTNKSKASKSGTIQYIPTIGPKDLALMNRVGNEFRHSSILEHISFNFFIDGISRACLQELARHRIASLSVKSSRYTLKELKDEPHFLNGWCISDTFEETDFNDDGYERALKYLVITDDFRVDICSIGALDNLLEILRLGISNDKAKYCLPESYRTQLTWSINLRSLQNFLSLRTDRKALPEIQHLANLIYQALPAEAQSLVAHCVKGGDDATI